MAKKQTITPDVAIATPTTEEQGVNLPGGLPSATDVAPKAETHDGLEINDPQDLRPTELPLIVKPANGGDWKNGEQAEYAKILNAAAYGNPARWALDKDVEIARLIEIGKDASAYYRYTGTQPGVDPLSFKTKLTPNS